MTKSDLLECVSDSFYNYEHKDFPLYYCQADIREIPDDFGNWRGCYILRSYSTIVAVAFRSHAEDEINGIPYGFHLYIFDYYSSTTNTTHIPRFRRWLKEKEKEPIYEHRLYTTSHDRKAYREYQKETDFENDIYYEIVADYLF